jgi:hypothetical protein
MHKYLIDNYAMFGFYLFITNIWKSIERGNDVENFIMKVMVLGFFLLVTLMIRKVAEEFGSGNKDKFSNIIEYISDFFADYGNRNENVKHYPLVEFVVISILMTLIFLCISSIIPNIAVINAIMVEIEPLKNKIILLTLLIKILIWYSNN